ncbi:MAG: hypothetical protein GC164_03285 [Phycisphaera sp.]|nr:hypothetical protein [Phycisphaera sp.]
MSKHQMIEMIRQQNRSAPVEFLLGFDETQLQTYLQRLTDVHGHRGRTSVWVRQGVTRSIVTRMHEMAAA